MLPVLPAFAGYVPDEFIKIYPNVSYSISPSWSNFVEPYGYVVLLEPVDPMFSKVASLFIQEQIYPFIFILLLIPSFIGPNISYSYYIKEEYFTLKKLLYDWLLST